jgi:hypothetical protein
MCSTVSTCPRVGARCYPPLLEITKEIMSRGPQVIDMEYRDPNRLEHGPGGPIFSSFQCLHFVNNNNIHHLSLVLYRRWFLLHEVMSPGIMVCVTLILKTFEYVHLVLFVSNGCLDLILIHSTMSGGMTGCPSKHVPIGFELPLGGS